SINSVSDVEGVSYLAEIGRKAIAEVVMNAEISEAVCERAATETEAASVSRARVAVEQAETAIRVKKNGLREQKANWEAVAASQEAEAEAARDTARARAELALQNVRAEVESKRLDAEVVVRAEAEAQARELRARGEASPILQRGHATAEALELMRQAWAEAGDGAKPIVMIQKLETILREVVERVGRVSVDKVQLVDRGDGSSLPAYVASYPAAVNAVLEQLNGVTGIDVMGTLAAPVREALTTTKASPA
ncbi:MAG: flotillin family protein, partial [Planctomycetota bacterium]